MNVLYIANKDPRIKSGGNELRTHLLWEVLKTRGRVYTIVINMKQEEKYIYVNDKHPICFANFKTSEGSFSHFMYRLSNKLSGLPILPYSLVTNNVYSEIFPHIVMDVAVCRYIHTFYYFHIWKALPTLLDIDDSPKELYETITQFFLPRILRPFGRWVNQLQTKYVISKVRGGWISNQEQLYNFEHKIKLLPNIPLMPSSKYNPNSERENYLFTIGAMSYHPNYTGVDKFLNEIWPLFHKEHPHVRYIIGGKGAPKDFAEKWNAIDGVSYIGFVDDLDDIYAKCIAVVVPIYAGGGTCIKTLESLAHSRVCITTPFGARGLTADDIKSCNGLCVFQNSFEFVSAYVNLANEQKRADMECGSFSFFHKHYSMNIFTKSVNEVLQII